ncbi:Sigma-70 region 2 [Altererythrobacter xiamenensis]|uniref:Sigma-70 region 2 n=1 Tax=Altererythrobacter xiamenensis TaxID=1316679 RepID=A0A1Y6F2T1_9SPHN|nr:sigma factor [Altererythrobacter xiamenensis]SMQ69107.1 Sigma-70 region 2 [Altererythrobacter xiamenensis]
MGELAGELEYLARTLSQMPLSEVRRKPLLYDRIFARLLDCLRPRIGHLIQRYGLSDMREDAEQACAIGVHRALETYDPRKARFTTHVTWQLRGELQSLRHRVRLDQRQSAQSAQVRTVSLEALSAAYAERGEVFEIVDETALQRVERTCSNALVRRSLLRLMNRIETPVQERVIVLESVFDREGDDSRYGKTREQRRQIVRRNIRNCARIAATTTITAEM